MDGELLEKTNRLPRQYSVRVWRRFVSGLASCACMYFSAEVYARFLSVLRRRKDEKTNRERVLLLLLLLLEEPSVSWTSLYLVYCNFKLYLMCLSSLALSRLDVRSVEIFAQRF